MATANTFTQIGSTVTVSTAVATISFTSIPATYTDLVLKLSTKTSRSGDSSDDGYVTFNGATTGFSYKLLSANGSTAGSSGASSTSSIYDFTPNGSGTNAAGIWGNAEIYIPNYAGSNYKSISMDAVMENNATASYQYLTDGLWSSTAAITSITLQADLGNFVQYSTASLYGILKY